MPICPSRRRSASAAATPRPGGTGAATARQPKSAQASRARAGGRGKGGPAAASRYIGGAACATVPPIYLLRTRPTGNLGTSRPDGVASGCKRACPTRSPLHSMRRLCRLSLLRRVHGGAILILMQRCGRSLAPPTIGHNRCIHANAMAEHRLADLSGPLSKGVLFDGLATVIIVGAGAHES